MQTVVQGDLLPEPWQGLLDNAAMVSDKTMQEMLAGRLSLMSHKKDIGELDPADEITLFQLQDFMDYNGRFKRKLVEWNIEGLKVAGMRVNKDTIRVKAITRTGSVLFDEASEGFPNDELMTKLALIAGG